MKKKTDPSLTELADAAFEQAARKVIERAIQTGTPVILWEDGAVKEVPPQEFVIKQQTSRPGKKARR